MRVWIGWVVILLAAFATDNICGVDPLPHKTFKRKPHSIWMASNAVVRHGMRGEIRLDKEKSGDKVDGVAALTMALSRAMVQRSTVSIYDSRGVLALG